MAIDISSPQLADTTVFDGEGGAYVAWTSNNVPIFATANLGAGKLVLKHRGFALPHYADSAKIGYVVKGACIVGLISPNSPQEKVLKITTGDAIPVPIGTISWWFNDDDSDLVIIFLGETKQSQTPGMFNYFFLTGTLGLLQGFSSEFVGKIYGIDEKDKVQKLVESQTNALLLKLEDNIKMPNKSNCNHEMIKSYVANHIRVINAENFPLLEQVGLSGIYERLEAKSVFGPKSCFNGDTIVYVTKGSGRVQIVGFNSSLALDADAKEGELFVVPKFFVVAIVASEEGMDFFSVSTSSRPVFDDLTGKLSAWSALSSPALQASLNVDAEFVEYFKSKIN